MAGLAVKMAPEILRSLAELVEKVRFRRVEVDPGSGKVVIDNPTKQQIEELIAGLDDHRAINPAPEDPPGA